MAIADEFELLEVGAGASGACADEGGGAFEVEGVADVGGSGGIDGAVDPEFEERAVGDEGFAFFESGEPIAEGKGGGIAGGALL